MASTPGGPPRGPSRGTRCSRRSPPTETDEANAIYHAERADWTWDEVLADADAASDALIAEIRGASDETIADDRIVGTTMGNGPEHDLAHLPALAARAGLEDRVTDLAAAVEASVARGGWPPRSAAFARYNLACYHALGGRLDEARALLRQALPGQEELQGYRAGGRRPHRAAGRDPGSDRGLTATDRVRRAAP